MDIKNCPECHEELSAESNFCPYCMTKLTPERVISDMRTKTHKIKIAYVILLCMLLVIATICMTLSIANQKKATEETVAISSWTMKLRPNGGVNSFQFCLENNIAGFGWGLKGTPSTIKEYRTMRTAESAYIGDTELDLTLNHFENMTSKDHVNLVWTTDSDGRYYIVEITGKYQYNRDDSHEAAGIVNFADCQFHPIGSEDLVPKAVVETLEGDGVIRFIHDAKATETTRQLWQIAKENNAE